MIPLPPSEGQADQLPEEVFVAVVLGPYPRGGSGPEQIVDDFLGIKNLVPKDRLHHVDFDSST